MHQTKKGNPWYLGRKAHLRADRDSKLVQIVAATAAHVANITTISERLHGEEQQVHGDAGYIGVEKRAEIVALERKINWQSPGQRGVIKALAEGAKKKAVKAVEKARAAVRGVCGRGARSIGEFIPASEGEGSGAGEERATTLHPVRAGPCGDWSASAGSSMKKT